MLNIANILSDNEAIEIEQQNEGLPAFKIERGKSRPTPYLYLLIPPNVKERNVSEKEENPCKKGLGKNAYNV